MSGYGFTGGEGRTGVILKSHEMGDDLVIFIYNDMAHIGAVAIGEYDFKNSRSSVSVVTRLGHKDDAIAQKAAYEISKSLKKAVCVIVGIHLDNITSDEINRVTANAGIAVKKYISSKTDKNYYG